MNLETARLKSIMLYLSNIMLDMLYIIIEINNNGTEPDVDEPVEFAAMAEGAVI